jgi:hypothetical protein
VAKMYNRVAEIADKNNIPFIDYNKMFDEIDFDFSDDMNNEGHVNIWGSEKITTHFGEFLKNNYKVSDHKNDDKYATWDADLKLYYREIAAQKLIAKDSITDYFDMLKNENYIIAISSSENSNVDKKLMENLKQADLQFDKGRKDDKYIAVLDSNNKVLEKWGDSGLSGEIALGDNKKLKIASSEDISGGTSILLDGVDYSIKGEGLNMVVYDKALGNIVDSIFIDSNNIITRSK